VDRRREIREFLMSRRARVTPEQAGLYMPHGDVRRVPGLRREEVADIAGVSADYYTQLERGDIDGASDSVLNAVARALRLDDAERLHLFHLARPDAATRLASSRGSIRPSVQRTLDAFTGGMALVRNRRWDYSRPTRWAARYTRRSSTTGSARRTRSGTCSSTIAPPPSSTTGRL
jgi:transcriptional regulator with XRE-family HTH domain